MFELAISKHAYRSTVATCMRVSRRVSLYTLPGWSSNPLPPLHAPSMNWCTLRCTWLRQSQWANDIQDICSNVPQLPVCALVTAADSSALCVRAKLTLMKWSCPGLCVGEMNCLTRVPKVELMPVRTTIASTSSLGSSAFHTCQPRDCV